MTVRTPILILSSAGCGLAAGLLALAGWNPAYTALPDTSGPAAIFDFNPARRYTGYLLLTLFPLIFAGAVAAWSRGRRINLPAVLAVFAAGGAGLLFLAGRTDSSVVGWISEAFSAPGAAGEILVLCGLLLAVWLPEGVVRPLSLATGAPADPEIAERRRIFSAFLLLVFHLFVLIQPCFGNHPSVPLIAVGCAAAMSFGMYRRRAAWPSGTGNAKEVTWPWIPLALWPLFAGLTRDVITSAAPQFHWLPYQLGALVVILAVLFLSLVRVPRLSLPPPALLLPFSVFALMRGSVGVAVGYDSFHQGEYSHPALAWSRGLVPFRDIFIVHGLGANTMGGLLAGDRLREFPNLDTWYLDLPRSAGVAVMFLFYFTLAGGKRWPVALFLALVTAQADPTKGGRHLGTQIALLFVLLWMRRPHAAWLAAAGAICAGWIMYSADTGVAALLSFGLWLLICTAKERRQPDATRGGASARGLVSFSAGAVGAAVVILALSYPLGMAGGMISQLLEFATVKPHYDSVPWVTPPAVYLLAPAATVLAVLYLIGFNSSRGKSDSVGECLGIRSILIPLAILNALTWLRTLDRPDEGHLIYAMAFTWPLLAALALGRESASSEAGSPAGSDRRIIALMLITLLIIPASASVRGERGPTTSPLRYVSWYMENCARPAALPRGELIEAESFFKLSAELDATLPQGAYLLDMTNRPAIYVHAHVLCPTRYYATFQHAPGIWQRRVIEDTERTRTQYILMPGPDHPGRRIDGIDVEVRHPLLAAYLARHFVRGAEFGDGSILFEHRGADNSESSGIGDPAGE